MGDGLQPHSSIPLLPRVDRLDSVMKHIEEKQNLARWDRFSTPGDRKEKQCMALDVAVREAHSKGSLLDRISSLEDQLIKLSLEIECSRTSPNSTLKPFLESSSTNEFKCEPIFSYPIFNNPNSVCKPESQLHINRHEFQRKSHRMQKNLEHPNPMNQQLGKNREEKTCKSGKRRTSNWPHLRILGC